MRIIDADALKKGVNGRSTHWLNDWSTLGVLAIIDEQPTISAVVHGEWMPMYDGNEYGDVFQCGCSCSICGEIMQSEPNYCPNCGAKMDGKENADADS